MALISLLVLLSLSVLCSSQTSYSSSVAGSTSSNAATVTVTSVSTLAIVILPSSSTQSSTAPYSYSSASLTSYASTLISTPSPTSTTIALQTVPYTGQPILVGTCNIPQYTALPFPDGSMLEVPLVGCSNDRPDCCPSLSFPNGTQPTATNVVSLLNQAPLEICPKDFIDIDPVCCPSGYTLYGQAIVGQTPCYTVISTAISVPQTVLASISTAVAASISAKSTTAAVSVLINQVFALSLPCGDDDESESESTGLSTGAKAGIGVGAGIGGLILLGLVWWFCLLARKRRQKKSLEAPVASNTTGPQYGGAPDQMYENKQYQYLPFPPRSPQPSYAVPGSPLNPHQSLGSHTSWSSQTHTMPGHMSLSSDGTRQYGALSPGSPSGYIPEMPAYQVQSRSQMHEMPAK